METEDCARPRFFGGTRTFLLIWAGQVVSLFGSGLTGFALGVWVYINTGSVTQFALISFFTTLPGIVFSPLAGALVDRWDRRFAMILADSGAAICTLAIALLLYAGSLRVWHIYLFMAIASTFGAFQWPAYSAAITLLVSKRQYGRSSGMVQLAEALAQIAAPAVAGVLVMTVQIYGILFIDFGTFLFALATLMFVRVPRPPASQERKKESFLQEASYGWTYIRSRPGLLALLVLFAFINFTTGIASVLFTPMILSFASASVLGMILSSGGLGMLMGNLIMMAWGGPKRRIYGIFGAEILVGISLISIGTNTTSLLLAIFVFLALSAGQINNACSQAIWQSKTAPEVQGRVFATRRMIAWSSLPLAYVVSGPLSDFVFEPLLTAGGPLAGSVGRLIGTGPGRGMGFFFIILGILCLVATLIAWSYGRLRLVESELPDAIQDKQAPARKGA